MAEQLTLENAEYVEELVECLQKGGTVQQIYGMSDGDLDVMMVAAGRYLNAEKYQEAADCFLFLTFLNPYKAKAWMGLGQAYKGLQQWKQAIQAYTMASIYDYDDPRPHFNAAHCYMALDNEDKVRERLSITLDLTRGKKEYASLQDLCFDLVDTINGEKEA